MTALRALAWGLAAMAGLDLCAVGEASKAAELSLKGKLYTLHDIDAKRIQIPSGRYIVGVADGAKEAVLQDMQATFEWTPETAMRSMPMFTGKLRDEHVRHLLQRKDVSFIEQDSVVKAFGGAEPVADQELGPM
uniref:Uncharacterized protein n=1 Tax=Zooxanthella nutricula TaxID=1333877 RepID=A0A6U6RJB0_9DINO